MVEGTQGIEFLPGVILAVVCANWVAHYIHHDGEGGRLKAPAQCNCLSSWQWCARTGWRTTSTMVVRGPRGKKGQSRRMVGKG